MQTVSLIDAMEVPEVRPDDKPSTHLMACEIAARLQEMDELDDGDESQTPAGTRLVQRLAAVDRIAGRRAYRLILDVLSRQQSLADSLDTLGGRHYNAQGNPQSRQAWLQHMQSDVEAIKICWPEVGDVLCHIMARRSTCGDG
jgi:hypothetical protein